MRKHETESHGMGFAVELLEFEHACVSLSAHVIH